MSVFLSPDLTPVTGGTYFPPDDKYGLIGFKSLLLGVAKEVHDTYIRYKYSYVSMCREFTFIICHV